MSDDETTPGPADEWGEDAPTILTAVPIDAVVDKPVEDITKPHDLAPVLEEARLRGRDEGCRACYDEGQADALIALRALMIFEGAPDGEIENVLAAVKARLTKL